MAGAPSKGIFDFTARSAAPERSIEPGRPWYRHVIYAPKPTYAPEVLPGVSEALDAGNLKQLADQVARLATALDRAAAVLETTPRRSTLIHTTTSCSSAARK